MERVLRLHSNMQVTITIVLLALALWGLLAARRGTVSGGFLGGLALAQLLLSAEALLGVLLLFGGFRPAGLLLHLIYGAIALLLIPSTWLFLRDRPGRWNILTYTGVCLILVMVAIRAYESAS